MVAEPIENIPLNSQLCENVTSMDCRRSANSLLQPGGGSQEHQRLECTWRSSAMRERHRFRPAGWDCLETRVALTHGGPISSGLIGTLSPNPRAGGPAARVVAQLNASFNEFTANYQQAQGAYLSSGTAADATAFKAYTDQAIGLLAQELTRTMSRVRGSLVYIKDGQQRSLHGGSSIVLQAILYSRINGPAGSGSLMATLNSTAVVPTTPPTGASATLYTLTAANAIQSARVAMINSVKLLVMNTFDNGH